MSSSFNYEDQTVIVSNQRFDSLIAFAIETGERVAQNEQDEAFVNRLREMSFWNGYDLYLLKDFPDLEERKFWAGRFLDVAQLIFQRELGNQDITYWQTSAIADAEQIARMLIDSVHRDEGDKSWQPETIASAQRSEYFKNLYEPSPESGDEAADVRWESGLWGALLRKFHFLRGAENQDTKENRR